MQTLNNHTWPTAQCSADSPTRLATKPCRSRGGGARPENMTLPKNLF